jgi:mRNA interferase MazF
MCSNPWKETILKAGDVYWVNLDPTIGDEIKKRRPVVVVNEGHDKHLRLAIVVPITGWASNWAKNPFFVSLQPDDINGLQKKSTIDCFQLRAISHDRFMERMGTISENEMNLIKKAIALILDIDSQHCA